MKKSKVVVFDLDDTLYKEIDYLKSAYKEIASIISKNTLKAIILEDIYNDLLYYYSEKKDVFKEIIDTYKPLNIVKEDLINIYRNHNPNITLSSENENVLKYLKKEGCRLCLITDGRSIQQRNKIKALEIEKYFEYILISEEFGSEKPNPSNFTYFEKLFGERSFFYIADNTSKDFITPKKLCWVTICLLDNGENIHKQQFDISEKYIPDFQITSLKQILNLF